MPLLLIVAPITVSLTKPKFLSTGFAEIAKRVNQSAIAHLPQLRKRLVRLRIGIGDFLEYSVGAVDNRRRRPDAHSAELRIKPHQSDDVCVAVLERMDVGSKLRPRKTKRAAPARRINKKQANYFL
jgi:hypothetical protein